MLDRLARLADSRPRWVAVAAVLFFFLAGGIGSSAFDALDPFGFDDPDSESLELERIYKRAVGSSSSPDVIVLVESGGRIETEKGLDDLGEVADTVAADPAIARVVSYADSPDPTLISDDGEATYVLGFFGAEADGDDEEAEAVERLEEAFAGEEMVTLGGIAVLSNQIGETVEGDLQRAELYALPLIILLSFIVFRSAVAALLPPMVGVLSIVGTLMGLRLLAEVTEISVFAINLVTGLGLGLAIDYSLFIVSRYREEMATHGPGIQALRRTLQTAGRTVIFSSLTVAAALAALMVFPQRFLFSMGLGGAMVALLAAAISLTVLPAVLSLLGPRINSLAPKSLRRVAEAEARGEQGRWYRFSRWVMARPGRIAATTAVAMILIGLPFTEARFVFADASILPERLSSRQVDDQLNQRFDERRLRPVEVQVETTNDTRARSLESFASEIEGVKGIDEVSSIQKVNGKLTRISALQGSDPYTPESQDSITAIRALDPEFDFQVGGQSAQLVDQKDSLVEHLLLAVPVIVVVTLVLLFLMTGSVVLPIKALLMNVLTVSAAFGILVLVFQDGRLEGLFDYASQGALDSSQPILLFALIFGLSTDYGVFLLTRIKEARDAGSANDEAVAIGIERTGRIVSFAALLFAIAIGAFLTSDLVFLKEVGLGTAVGVLIDATIVRALLVPSLMGLLGEWNWWAPAPLRRLHRRFGFSE